MTRSLIVLAAFVVAAVALPALKRASACRVNGHQLTALFAGDLTPQLDTYVIARPSLAGGVSDHQLVARRWE